METNKEATGVRVWLILTKAQKALQAQSEADIRRQGMCMSDFAVLEVLLHKGTLPVNTIGRKVLLTSGSISVAIDRLERRNLVVRIKSPQDGRITLVALTPQGHSLISEVFDRHEGAMNELVAHMPEADRSELIRLLKQLGQPVAAKGDPA